MEIFSYLGILWTAVLGFIFLWWAVAEFIQWLLSIGLGVCADPEKICKRLDDENFRRLLHLMDQEFIRRKSR